VYDSPALSPSWASNGQNDSATFNLFETFSNQLKASLQPIDDVLNTGGLGNVGVVPGLNFIDHFASTDPVGNLFRDAYIDKTAYTIPTTPSKTSDWSINFSSSYSLPISGITQGKVIAFFLIGCNDAFYRPFLQRKTAFGDENIFLDLRFDNLTTSVSFDPFVASTTEINCI
jgi:hypothetical protein